MLPRKTDGNVAVEVVHAVEGEGEGESESESQGEDEVWQ